MLTSQKKKPKKGVMANKPFIHDGIPQVSMTIVVVVVVVVFVTTTNK